MAAATGGEVARLETIGDVTCTAIAAFELAADWQRIERWGQVVETWIRQHNNAPVIGFCNACCAELFLSSGQWEMAEGLLTEGLDVLRSSDQRARCVHPAAKLAELRLLQGRIEEAEQLLAGYEELPEAAHALASLYLARDETSVAAAVIHRRLNRSGGDSVLAAPFLALLVDVQLADGDVVGAASSTERLTAIGERSALPRIRAAAAFAAGKVAAARGDDDASDRLAAAVAAFSEQGMTLDAALARMQLARSLEDAQPEVAVADARAALAEFERLGAPRHADAAAAFLRGLGSTGRTGPKGMDLLTRREKEVLALLGQGLTNAQIGERLFISTKTAGHHVSSILGEAASAEPLGGCRLRPAGRRRDPDPEDRESSGSFERASRARLHLTDEGGEVHGTADEQEREERTQAGDLALGRAPHDGEPGGGVRRAVRPADARGVGRRAAHEEDGLRTIDAPAGEAVVGTEFASMGDDRGVASPIDRS